MTTHNSWQLITSHLPPSTTTTIMGTITLLSSNPLFSTLFTLYLLILLYLPHPLLRILLSPLLISTSILLFLLRLGTSQQLKPLNESPHQVETQLPTEPSPVAKPGPMSLDHGEQEAEAEAYKAEAPCKRVETLSSIHPEPRPKPEPESCGHGRAEMGLSQLAEGADPHCYRVETLPKLEPEPQLQVKEKIPARAGRDIPNQEGWEPKPGLAMGLNLFCRKTFVGWEVGAPLEVIYEAGEEEGDEEQNDAFHNNIACKMERYPSLSRYYPESDSDSDSECSSSLWEEEEEREELIEIALDYYGDKGMMKKMIVLHDEVQIIDDDEDNLIEIDISPTRINSGFWL